MKDVIDFVQIRGNEAAKRALLVALVGRHSIVLFGPAGHGKTMLLDAARGIYRDFEGLDVTINTPADLEQIDRHGLAMADMHCEVAAVPFAELVGSRLGTSTAYVESAYRKARQFASARLEHTATAAAPGSLIGAAVAGMSDGCRLLLKQAYSELALSPRSIISILRVARTIADLDAAGDVGEMHLAESIFYRQLDRRH
jgi:predicted ATPase with chaperone activity